MVGGTAKAKPKAKPLHEWMSRDVEDADQSFRRQLLWRELRCRRIARDFLSLTVPSLLSRGTRQYSEGQKNRGEPGAPGVSREPRQRRNLTHEVAAI